MILTIILIFIIIIILSFIFFIYTAIKNFKNFDSDYNKLDKSKSYSKKVNKNECEGVYNPEEKNCFIGGPGSYNIEDGKIYKLSRNVCDKTCESCGYSEYPDLDDECLKCKKGLIFLKDNDDGTGYCTTKNSKIYKEVMERREDERKMDEEDKKWEEENKQHQKKLKRQKAVWDEALRIQEEKNKRELAKFKRQEEKMKREFAKFKRQEAKFQRENTAREKASKVGALRTARKRKSGVNKYVKKITDNIYKNINYSNKKYNNRKYVDRKYKNTRYDKRYDNTRYNRYDNTIYGNKKYSNRRYDNTRYNRRYDNTKYNRTYGKKKYGNTRYSRRYAKSLPVVKYGKKKKSLSVVKYGKKKKLFEICYENSECLSNNCSNVSSYTDLKKCYQKPTVLKSGLKSGYSR